MAITSGGMGRMLEGGKKPKKWTFASDKKWDKANGVKEGSKRDKALDKKRGVPEKGRKKK